MSQPTNHLQKSAPPPTNSSSSAHTNPAPNSNSSIGVDLIPILVSLAESNGSITEWQNTLTQLAQTPSLIQSLSGSIIGQPLLAAIKSHRRDFIELLLKHHSQYSSLYAKSDTIQVRESALTGIPRTVEHHLSTGVAHSMSQGLHDVLKYFYENGLPHQDYCPESAFNPKEDEIRLKNLQEFYRLWHPKHSFDESQPYEQLRQTAHAVNSIQGLRFLEEEDDRQANN